MMQYLSSSKICLWELGMFGNSEDNMQHKAYKFRMFPTEEQAEIMWKIIGCARFMYNQILADRSLYHELYEDCLLYTSPSPRD